MYIYIILCVFSLHLLVIYISVFLFKGIRHYSVYVCMCFHNFYALKLFICLLFKSTMLFIILFLFCCCNQKSAKYRLFFS